MPFMLKKSCPVPGCPELTSGGRCEKHRTKKQSGYDSKRGNSAARGYDRKWRKRREKVLRENMLKYGYCFPTCESCGDRIPDSSKAHVDHIEPHGGDPVKFTGPVQVLCIGCHNKKTRGEGGADSFRW